VPTFAVIACSVQSFPTTVSLSFLDWGRYCFFQAAPPLFLLGWVDSVPDPLLLRESGNAGDQTLNLWICSQEFWPLDHRSMVGKALLCHLNSKSLISEICVVADEMWPMHWPNWDSSTKNSVKYFKNMWRVFRNILTENIKFYWIIYLWDWSGIESTITAAIYWSVVLDLNDRWYWLWSNRWNVWVVSETEIAWQNLPYCRSVHHRSHIAWP
jgi:hypothetical protein